MPINTIAENTAGNATSKTTVSESTAGNATSKTTVSAASAGNATSKTTVAAASAGNATSKTTVSAASAGNATSKTTVAAASAGNATSKTVVSAAGTPRALVPVSGYNFASGSYAQNGVPATFADTFTFDRASTASYMGRTVTNGKASYSIMNAAVDEPRYEYDPSTGEKLGILIEGSSTNLLLRSEEFDNASWTKTRSSVTVNDINSLDQTASADLLLEDSTATNSHYARYTATVTNGATYTQSIYAKFKSRPFLWIGNNAGNSSSDGAWFNIQLGTVGVTRSGWTANIEPLSDGWYRCSVTGDATSTTWFADFALSDTNGETIYSGDGSSGLYIWGAQLEELSLATSYIKTGASAVTRSSDDLSITAPDLPDVRTGQELSIFAECRFLLGGGDINRAVYSEAAAAGQFALLRYDAATAKLRVYRSGSPHGDIDQASIYSTLKHITSIEADNTLTTYKDGVLDLSLERVPSVQGALDVMMIGRFSASTEYMYGHIKKLAFYDYALTAQEVGLI